MFLLVIAILFLVLLLTGVLGSVILVGIQVIGWIIVAILIAVLVWKIISPLFSPLISWNSKRREVSEIQETIRKRKGLGYETEELEKELQEIEKKYDKWYQEAKKRRESLGYHDD